MKIIFSAQADLVKPMRRFGISIARKKINGSFDLDVSKMPTKKDPKLISALKDVFLAKFNKFHNVMSLEILELSGKQ